MKLMKFAGKFKKMFFKNLIFFIGILFSSSLYAQDYKCSYEFDGDIFPLVLEKVSDYSYDFTMSYTTQEFILFENDNYLTVGNPQRVSEQEIVYRTIFVDKINKLISITSVIEPQFYETYQRGVWGDVLGKCD